MAQPSNPNCDPYPWVTVDEEGNEYRVHTAHEDGTDEYGNLWEGWVLRSSNP